MHTFLSVGSQSAAGTEPMSVSTFEKLLPNPKVKTRGQKQ